MQSIRQLELSMVGYESKGCEVDGVEEKGNNLLVVSYDSSGC